VLKVKVKLNAKVKNTVQLPDGAQEITLFGGEKLVADMVISTYGVLPNSSFVPAQFLNDNGFIKVDEYFHVKDAEGVFAIGDVSDAEPPQFIFVDRQSTHIAKNIVLNLRGMVPQPYKVATSGTLLPF
jgi:NADH dehydrogenase FAD-containing subunit